MQDAFGGILNIFLIAVFLIVVEGILAVTVSYTKAFKMKNYVIASIEQYEGSGCFPTNVAGAASVSDTACVQRIRKYAKHIAYSPANLKCWDDYTNVEGLFCYGEVKDDGSLKGQNTATNKYYRVITQVDISFPLVNRIMGLRFFQVSGDTRLIVLNTD
jgi:hypothetical protein